MSISILTRFLVRESFLEYFTVLIYRTRLFVSNHFVPSIPHATVHTYVSNYKTIDQIDDVLEGERGTDIFQFFSIPIVRCHVPVRHVNHIVTASTILCTSGESKHTSFVFNEAITLRHLQNCGWDFHLSHEKTSNVELLASVWLLLLLLRFLICRAFIPPCEYLISNVSVISLHHLY